VFLNFFFFHWPPCYGFVLVVGGTLFLRLRVVLTFGTIQPFHEGNFFLKVGIRFCQNTSNQYSMIGQKKQQAQRA